MPKGTKAEVKKRQDQAIRFNSQGLGATAIAERLGCAASTVRNYLRNGRLSHAAPSDGRVAAPQAKASSGTNNRRPRKKRVAKKVTVHVAQGEGEPPGVRLGKGEGSAPAVRLGKGEIPDGDRLGGSLALPAALKNATRNEVRERLPKEKDAEQSSAVRESKPQQNNPEQSSAVRESADPESISLVHELRRLLAQASEDDLSQSRARHLMDCALRLAEKGDFKFFKEILDRIDGKSPAHVGGDDDSLAQLPEDELDRLIALAQDGTREAQAQG